MGKFEKEKRGAKKDNQHAAKGRQQEPITDASDAATRALRHLPVAVPPASSTDAYMETAADYQGSIRNDDEVPQPGQSAIKSSLVTSYSILNHGLSYSDWLKSEEGRSQSRRSFNRKR